jgi:Coenzyme PQQ synthesis protein D (PqqD)
VILEKDCEETGLSESQRIVAVDFHQASANLYIRAKAVVSRLIAADTLVLPLRAGIGDLTSLYSLNATATTIWDALETPQTLQRLCDLIDSKYDLSREKAEEDVALFMGQICSLGLAERVVDSEAAPPTGER